MTDSIPDGLSELEYARHLCEEILAWPARGNLELLGDCIRSLSISKKLTMKRAYQYLARAVKLAKQQGIAVDHFFFSNGVYTEIKPEKSTKVPWFKSPSKEELAALEAHRETPEFKQAQQEMEALLKRLCALPKFQTSR